MHVLSAGRAIERVREEAGHTIRQYVGVNGGKTVQSCRRDQDQDLDQEYCVWGAFSSAKFALAKFT